MVSTVLLYKKNEESDAYWHGVEQFAKTEQENQKLRLEITSLQDGIPKMVEEKLSAYRQLFQSTIAEALSDMLQEKLLAYRQWILDELSQNYVSLGKHDKVLQALHEEMVDKDAVIDDLRAKLSACDVHVNDLKDKLFAYDRSDEDKLLENDSLLHATHEVVTSCNMQSERYCHGLLVLLIALPTIAFTLYVLWKLFGDAISRINDSRRLDAGNWLRDCMTL